MGLHNGMPYRTKDELEFIDALGREKFWQGVRSTRVTLLRNYYLGCRDKRKVWGALDGAKIIEYAKQSLIREMAGLSDAEVSRVGGI